MKENEEKLLNLIRDQIRILPTIIPSEASSDELYNCNAPYINLDDVMQILFKPHARRN